MLPIGGIYPTWHPHQTRARVKFYSTKLKTAKKSRSKAAQTTPKKSASMAIVEAPTRAATPKPRAKKVALANTLVRKNLYHFSFPAR